MECVTFFCFFRIINQSSPKGVTLFRNEHTLIISFLFNICISLLYYCYSATAIHVSLIVSACYFFSSRCLTDNILCYHSIPNLSLFFSLLLFLSSPLLSSPHLSSPLFTNSPLLTSPLLSSPLLTSSFHTHHISMLTILFLIAYFDISYSVKVSYIIPFRKKCYTLFRIGK